MHVIGAAQVQAAHRRFLPHASATTSSTGVGLITLRQPAGRSTAAARSTRSPRRSSARSVAEAAPRPHPEEDARAARRGGDAARRGLRRRERQGRAMEGGGRGRRRGRRAPCGPPSRRSRRRRGRRPSRSRRRRRRVWRAADRGSCRAGGAAIRCGRPSSPTRRRGAREPGKGRIFLNRESLTRRGRAGFCPARRSSALPAPAAAPRPRAAGVAPSAPIRYSSLVKTRVVVPLGSVMMSYPPHR